MRIPISPMVLATLVAMLASVRCGEQATIPVGSSVPPGFFDLELLASDPIAAAKDYVRRTPDVGIASEDIRRAEVSIDAAYLNTMIYQEYHGVPVAGAVLALRVDRESGRVTATIANTWQNVDSEFIAEPEIAAVRARERALAAWREASAQDSNQDTLSLEIIPKSYLPLIDAMHLAWKIHLRNWALTPPEHRIVYIDAHTGTLLYVGDNQIAY